MPYYIPFNYHFILSMRGQLAIRKRIIDHHNLQSACQQVSKYFQLTLYTVVNERIVLS